MPLPSYTVSQVPVTGGVEPWGIAYEPNTNTIWSCDFALGIVYILDATTHAVVNSFALNLCNQCCSDGTDVWITWTDTMSNRFVAKVDPTTLAIAGSAAVGAGNGAVTAANGHIWVANPNDSTVTKVDAATIAVIGTYSTGAGTNPLGLSYDPVSLSIWTANSGNGTVSKLLESTGALTATYGVGAGPQATISDGTHIWVTDGGTFPGFIPSLRQLDPTTGAQTGLLGFGTFATDFLNGLAWDGTYLWVADGFGGGGNNLIAAVDPVAVSLLASFPAYPNGNDILLTVAPGPNIWASNNNFPFLTLLAAGAAASAAQIIGTHVGFMTPGHFGGGTK